MRSVRCALRCVVLCCVVLFLIVFCPAAFLFVAFRFSRFVVSLPFLFVFFLNLWRFSLCAMCACGFVQRHFVLFGVECFCWFHYGLLVALLFFVGGCSTCTMCLSICGRLACISADFCSSHHLDNIMIIKIMV